MRWVIFLKEKFNIYILPLQNGYVISCYKSSYEKKCSVNKYKHQWVNKHFESFIFVCLFSFLNIFT